jgi:hypothetical protein
MIGCAWCPLTQFPYCVAMPSQGAFSTRFVRSAHSLRTAGRTREFQIESVFSVQGNSRCHKLHIFSSQGVSQITFFPMCISKILVTASVWYWQQLVCHINESTTMVCGLTKGFRVDGHALCTITSLVNPD